LAVWPATGKTIIARELTRRLAASYLRIDTIEQRLREAGLAVGASGYVVANALAAENLLIGRTVIADCVNAVAASRNGWRETADRCAARDRDLVDPQRCGHPSAPPRKPFGRHQWSQTAGVG
jgi:predicted kinase